MRGLTRGVIHEKGPSERHRRLEVLRRKAKEIRDFLIDVYNNPPISPVLSAYDKAITELVREQPRGRVVPRCLSRFTTRLKALKWRDERKLMRALDGPFATISV